MVAAELRACAAAFTFLTRAPVHRLVAHGQDDLARAATYFPLVGLVVGLVGGATYVIVAIAWSTTLAVVLSIAVTVWLTGAFHEDALADAFDGFGGGWDRAQILAIMKDSRVGSYALVGVVLVLAAKIAALASIGERGSAIDVVRALVAGHVLGRWSSIPLMWRLPYARPETDGERPSAGRPMAGGVTSEQVVVTILVTTLIVAVTAGSRALLVGAAALAVTLLCGRYFNRRLGGITGDALGAANQLVELSAYLVLSARFP